VTPPPYPKTLVGRILGGSILAALLTAAALAVLVATLLSLRKSVDQEAHSNDTVAAALTLQSKVSSFESALHGYLLTTDSRFGTSLTESRGGRAPGPPPRARRGAGARGATQRGGGGWGATGPTSHRH
jgi:hypothetical protein